MPDDDPLLALISPLAGAVLAVILSILVSATVAGRVADDYATGALIYTACVLWVIAGAVIVFVLAHKGETRRLSAGRVLLWTASIWLWPAFAWRAWRRRARPDADSG